MSEQMIIWTVYDHPIDYPHNYVARKFVVDATGPRPTEEFMVCLEVEVLRMLLADRGLTCLTRSPEDDPKIMETWL